MIGLTGPGIGSREQAVPAVAGVWRGNDELQAMESAVVDQRAEMMRRQTNPVVTSLAGHFRSLWESARDHKQREVEPRLLKCLLARKGEYSAEQKQAIEQEGSPAIYMMLTDEKCSSMESWLHDIFDQADDLPFAAEETPVPDVDPMLRQEVQAAAQSQMQHVVMTRLQQEVMSGQIGDQMQAQQRMEMLMREEMQGLDDDLKDVLHEEAKEHTERMVRQIKDVAVEAGWMEALLESISDFCTYPNSFIKGPCDVNRQVLEWADGKPAMVSRVVQTWTAPSPWDIFPGPENRGVQDGFLIERHYLTSKDLHGLIGVEGYDDEALRAVIRDHTGGGLQSTWLDSTTENERQRLEGRDRLTSSPEPLIPALQIWADVPGMKLVEYGLSTEMVQDITRHYPVEAWLIGGYVIKCVINPNLNGERPYYSAGFRAVKGSFWQRALPEVIADCQTHCNVAARSLARNMSIASGPQVGVDIGAMPPGESIDDIFPMKIWQFDLKQYMGSGSDSRQPLWFFQPPLLAQELLKVYEFWNAEADNKSGIPRYATGAAGGQQGALGTASGMSMMLANATKGIKRVAKNIDRLQIEPSIQSILTSVLMRNPDGYRGDIKIQAVGATALLHKEALQVRRNEAMQVVQNPMVLQVIGMDGYAEVLRQYFKGLEFGNIVPSKREILQKQRESEMQAQQQQAQQIQMQQDQRAIPAGATREVESDGSVSGDNSLFQGGGAM